jgi:hypothetical protein
LYLRLGDITDSFKDLMIYVDAYASARPRLEMNVALGETWPFHQPLLHQLINVVHKGQGVEELSGLS